MLEKKIAGFDLIMSKLCHLYFTYNKIYTHYIAVAKYTYFKFAFVFALLLLWSNLCR